MVSTTRASSPQSRRSQLAASSLWLIYVMVGIPLAVFVAWWGNEQRNIPAQIRLETVHRSEVVAQALESHLQHMRSHALLIARSPSVARDDLEALHSWGERLVNDPDILLANLVVHDADGRQLLNTALLPDGTTRPPRSPDLPQRRGPIHEEMYREMMRTMRPVFSGVFVGPVLKDHIVVVMVPVLRDGVLYRTLSLTTRAAQIRTVLEQHVQSTTHTVVVVDRRGTIVARVPNHSGYVGKQVVPDFVAAARLNGEWREQGTWEGRNGEGIAIFGAYHRLHTSGWVAEVALPQAEINAPTVLYRLLFAVVAAVLAATGGIGWYLSTRITKADMHAELLVRELAHRVKNTLASISAIARISGRYAKDYKAFLVSFEQRIQSLAIAHDMLFDQRRDGALLGTLIERELSHYSQHHTLEVGGPEVPLNYNEVLGFAMTISELGTNAAKYGAFSKAGGIVKITWTCANNQLCLVWQECGGPPIECQPQKTGFGSRVIDLMITRDLGGTVEYEYQRTGLVCRITVPH